MRILCRRGGCTARERVRRRAYRRRRPAAPGRN